MVLTAPPGWLRGFGRQPQTSRLAGLLRDYPPYLGPFPGPGWERSLMEAEANLAHLLDHRSERLNAVGGLLQEFGIVAKTSAHSDPRPMLDQIWSWIREEWPAVFDPRIARREACRNPAGAGAETVLSMVMDLGILAGEIVLAHRPDFGWALDSDPDHFGFDTGVSSQRQPVVLRPADEEMAAILFDPVGLLDAVYTQCRSPTLFLLNTLGRGVRDTVQGAFEAVARDRSTP